MKKYAIKHETLGYFAGVDSEFMMARFTKDPARGKTWKTETGAANTINKYSGAGYGMPAERCSVVEVEVK